jgi:O-antigen/teichoic acid export membrane protein
MTTILLVEMRKASVEAKNFKKLFNAAFLLTLLVAAPISGFLFCFHELTTLILLGENWVEYSQLLGGFSLLITSAVFHQHCSKILIIFNKPKHLFLYEIITFIIIYSVLYAVGLGDLILFTYTRVGIEQLLTLFFLVYVSLKYTDMKSLLKLMVGIGSILASCIASASFVSFFAPLSNFAIVNLALIAATFFILFYAIFSLCYLAFLRRFSEWEYIYSLTLRMLMPILNKFVRN